MILKITLKSEKGAQVYKMVKRRCDNFLMGLVISIFLISFIPKDLANAHRLPSGSYQQTCRNISLNGNVLECECRKGDGNWIHTRLNIKRCEGEIWNDNGKLKCQKQKRNKKQKGNKKQKSNKLSQPQGSYKQTCRNCNVYDGKLNCECRKGNGSWQRTIINFSNCGGSISNINGQLRCD
jgi:CVNH domain